MTGIFDEGITMGEQIWLDLAVLQVIAVRLDSSAGLLDAEASRLGERGLDRLALSIRSWSEATSGTSRRLAATVHALASQDLENAQLLDGTRR